MEKLSPLNMNKLGLIIFLINIATASIGQSQGVTLGNVYDAMKKISTSITKEVRSERFENFDFIKFKPTGRNVSEDYFEVGFDSNNNILRIEHHESKLRLTNFRLNIYYFSDFRIYTYQKIDSNQAMYEPIVFVFDNHSKKHFVLNIRDGNGIKSHIKINYETFPYSKIESLSAVMILRSDFYPKDFVRIYDGRIFMHSEFIYSDSITVKNESARLLSLSKDIKVSKDTCLSEFESVGDMNSDLSMTIEPLGNPNYRKVPFWVYGGAHNYQ